MENLEENKKSPGWVKGYLIKRQRVIINSEIIIPYLKKNYKYFSLILKINEYQLKFYDDNSYEILKTIALNYKKNILDIEDVTQIDHLPESSNKKFKAILNLAIQNENLLLETILNSSIKDLKLLITELSGHVPIYLIVSHLGYPMGGGESYLFQTARLMNEVGYQCKWHSFKDSNYKNNECYEKLSTPYYEDVRECQELTSEYLRKICEDICPDVIHSQGASNEIVQEVAHEVGIPALVGYHFWSGSIDLDESVFNKKIEDNLHLHKISEVRYKNSPWVKKYFASDYMKKIYEKLGGQEHFQVIHPIPDASHYEIDREKYGMQRDKVLQINIHPLKGGYIFKHCVEKLSDKYKFVGVKTEDLENNFYNEILNLSDRSELVDYTKVSDLYAQAKLVLIPTLVDETFFRVAYESVMNGIPVLSTNNGNLKFLFGEGNIYLDENPEAWAKFLEDIYDNQDLLNSIAELQKEYVSSQFNSQENIKFIDAIVDLSKNSRKKNVGIFTVWGDIGLGYLSATYAKILCSIGYRVHIFSFQAYSSAGCRLRQQASSKEWDEKLVASCYYSYNNREEVSQYEINQFIDVNKIGALIFPEICWEKNWKRIFSLEDPNLKKIGIPMVEIVLNDEVENHNKLTKTFYCNTYSQDVLKKYGVTNGVYIGHGHGFKDEDLKKRKIDLLNKEKIQFLHIAGYNPTGRKKTSKVIEAFKEALKYRSDISLLIYLQVPLRSFYFGDIPKDIEIVNQSVDQAVIRQAYQNSTISIQVSSHEGLGLGFYESLAEYTPVITLNVRPHRDIVTENIGWILEAKEVDIVDNNKSIVMAGDFEINDLTSCLLSINKHQINEKINKIDRDYFCSNSEINLAINLLKGLN